MRLPINILVVDDDSISRFLIKNVLEEKNFNVISAEQGQQALDYFHKMSFDLILSDINMPHMDGICLTKNIRSFSEIPIIGMTAGASQKEMDQAKEAGMSDLFFKPLDFLSLINKIYRYTAQEVSK